MDGDLLASHRQEAGAINSGVERRAMIIFSTNAKDYRASSGVEIARELERDAVGYPYRGESIRKFLHWSLERLKHRIPPRDMDLSERMEDEALALTYLCLRDEYGAGKLMIIGRDASAEA